MITTTGSEIQQNVADNEGRREEEGHHLLFPSSRELQESRGRRSRLEIYNEVLRLIGSGVEKPTHIMYEANLSWSALDECLEALQHQHLVISKPTGNGRISYHLSNRGYDLMSKLLTLRESIGEMKL